MQPPFAPTESLLCDRSATGLRWKLREADTRAVAGMMQQWTLSELVARLVSARGIASEDTPDFLAPSLRASLPDPSHLKDMDRAAERLAAAIVANEKIAVFGDYDVDGATSSALLIRYLRALGANAVPYIPDRIKEGYGPNAAALLALQQNGVSLALTVDCGTLAFEPLQHVFDAGLDVIVVDHHAGEPEMPKCYALVNPNRFDETSPHKQLAAVGVTFLLLVATQRLLKQQNFSKPLPDLLQWLDIVALGTVCDVVPLTGVNRAFVTQGLKVLRSRSNLGLATLMDVANLNEPANTFTLGYVLGPRINAGGRVGQADLGVRLMTTDDPAEALEISQLLEKHNAERRSLEAQALEEAMVQAAFQENQPMIVVGSAHWHPGVIGIVASRLKERFHKPAAAIAWVNGVGKASARSIEGVDMGAIIIAARQQGLLLAGGGHAMAAGFTVAENQREAFESFVQSRVETACARLEAIRTLWIDGHIHAQGLTPQLMDELERIGPFGAGNPGIRLLLKNVMLAHAEVVKEQHLRVMIQEPGGVRLRLPVMAFRAVSTPLGQALLGARGKVVDMVGSPKLNHWMGETRVNFHIDDLSLAN